MNDLHHSIGRLLTAAALLAITFVGAGSSARAQDDDDEDEVPAQAQVNMNGFVMNDAQFDQWVFGNMGVANAGVARNKLDSLLTLNVEDLERTCGLTPIQKKKLLLAGRGDIKRFFDRIEDMRKKFTKSKNDQNQFSRSGRRSRPFAIRLQLGLLRRGVDLRQGDQGDLEPRAGRQARGGGARSDALSILGPR